MEIAVYANFGEDFVFELLEIPNKILANSM